MTPVAERRLQRRGRLVRCPGGYQACVPEPLPPPIAWTAELVTALSSATLAAGKLAGEGRRLPNPHLVIQPFLRREAVLSSRIEGTETTLGELLADEAGGTVERNRADLREVGNYVSALDYGLYRLPTLPLSLRLVRELHQRLMQGVRGDAATPGEFRRSQNWIGPPGCSLNDATYVPPPPSELMACLDAWERFLHHDTLPPLVHAALAHAQFEAIPPLSGRQRPRRPSAHHPAAGRTGRTPDAAALPERLVRGHAPGILRPSSGSDAGRRMGAVAGIFPAGCLRCSPTTRSIGSGASTICTPAGANDLAPVIRRCLRAPSTSLSDTRSGPHPDWPASWGFRSQRPSARSPGWNPGIVSLAWAAKRNRVYCARPILEILDEPSAAGRD